jgi:cell division protease FtsH
LGRDIGHQRDYSEDVAASIDDEVRSLIESAHYEAYEALVENREVLDALVVELLAKETLNKEEIAKIFEPLKQRPISAAWTGSDRRIPSNIPPVEVPELAVAEVSGAPSEAVEVEDSTKAETD